MKRSRKFIPFDKVFSPCKTFLWKNHHAMFHSDLTECTRHYAVTEDKITTPKNLTGSNSLMLPKIKQTIPTNKKIKSFNWLWQCCYCRPFLKKKREIKSNLSFLKIKDKIKKMLRFVHGELFHFFAIPREKLNLVDFYPVN